MRTKIFFSVLVILTMTFLGMAKPSLSSHYEDTPCIEDVSIPENLSQDMAVQEEQEKKKEKEKTEKAEKKEDKEKTKDVFVWHTKDSELKKIHEKLQKIHERLSKKMESKTEEEEQALKDMEETLKKLEKKLDVMENKLKDITVSIHEEPHRIHLKHGHKISIKHKTDTEEGEVDVFTINKDKGHLMTFVNDEGEATFLAHMNLEKAQKQAFTDAVEEIKEDLPEGYDIESEFDDESGKATIKIKGSAKSKDTKDVVIDLLKELKEKLDPKN